MVKVSNKILFVTLAYIALALILSLTVLINGNVHLLGDDGAGLAFWAAWWPGHAVAHNYDMVYNHFTLFQINSNLLPVLSLPVSLFYGVLTPIVGTVQAYNLLLPLYIVLNGLCVFAYLRCSTRNNVLPAIGGMLLALNPVTYELAQHGEIGLMGFFVIPLCLLLWDRWIAKPTFWRALVVIIALYGIVVASMQFWSFIFTVLLPYALYSLRQITERKSYIDSFLPAVLVFAVLMFIYPVSPVLWSQVLPFYPPLSIWQGVGTPDWIGWLFLGIGVCFVAGVVWRSPGSPLRSVWFVSIALNLIVYLLPTTSPLVLLGIVPLENLARLLVLWLPIIFAGLNIIVRDFDVNKRFGRVWIVAGIVLVMLSIADWVRPLPTTPLLPSSFDAIIAADPEDYLIADFPTGIDTLQRRAQRNAGIPVSGAASLGVDYFAGRVLMDSVLYRKPVIGGLSASLQPGDTDPYTRNPLLQLLVGGPLETGSKSIAQRIREDTERWRVGYIIVRLDQLSQEFVTGLHGWLTWTNAYCLVAVEGEREFWRAAWHPAGCTPPTLHLGDPSSQMALGVGWYTEEQWGDQPVRWAGKETASTITLWLLPRVDYELRVRVSAPQGESQMLEVLMNGESIGQTRLQKDWGEYTFAIPRRLIPPEGFVIIQLHHTNLYPVEGRRLTAAYDYISLNPAQP